MDMKPDLVVRYLVRRDAGRAEIRLMIALLQDAVGCFRRHLLARDKMRQGLFREAETWVMSEESSRPFSFDHVCEVVGLNADYLRRLLRQWRDQQLAARGLPYVELEVATPADVRIVRRERRTFSDEFKAETVRRVIERGRRIRAVARELDLNASLVSSWVRVAEMSATATRADRDVLQLLLRESQAQIQPEVTGESRGSLVEENT